MNRWKPGWIALFLLLVVSRGLAADAPTVSAIVDQVIARLEAERKELQTMQYDLVSQIDELDESGKVVKHQERHAIVRPGGTPEIEVVSVTGDELSMSGFRAKRQGNFQEKIEKGRQDFSLKKMVARFNVTLQGQVDLGGHPAYLLNFDPKPDQSSDNPIEGVLNQMHGQIWVSSENYTILQAKAQLAKSASVFMLNIKKLNIDYLFQGKTVSELGPNQLDITLQATGPLHSIHRHQQIILSGFQPRK